MRRVWWLTGVGLLCAALGQAAPLTVTSTVLEWPGPATAVFWRGQDLWLVSTATTPLTPPARWPTAWQPQAVEPLQVTGGQGLRLRLPRVLSLQVTPTAQGVKLEQTTRATTQAPIGTLQQQRYHNAAAVGPVVALSPQTGERYAVFPQQTVGGAAAASGCRGVVVVAYVDGGGGGAAARAAFYHDPARARPVAVSDSGRRYRGSSTTGANAQVSNTARG